MNSNTKATFKQLYWTVWILNSTFHYTLNLANSGLTIKFSLYHAYVLFSYKKKNRIAIKESRTDNIMNICQIEIKQYAPPSQNMLFIHCSTLPPPYSVTSNDARATVPTDIRHIFKPTFPCTEWDSVANYLSYFCSLFYDTFSIEIANQVVNHAFNGLI